MAESLDKLQNRILSDARLKASEIITEAEGKAKQILQEAQAESRKEVDEILSKATVDAESIRRNILSARIRTNRLRILDERNKIIQNVLKSVEDELSELPSTDLFQPALKRFVSEAIEAIGTDDAIVRVGFPNSNSKSLESIGRSLPKGTKLIVESTPIGDLGGVVASDSSGKTVFNNSLRARFERLDTQLLTAISSTIFGE